MIKPYSYKKQINYNFLIAYFYTLQIISKYNCFWQSFFTQKTRNTIELLINIKNNKNLINKSYSSNKTNQL